jgi:murein DD-endopeptidase MepM/ murein hydrolase activator NlpD
MQAKTVGAFALGFAAGLLSLCVLLGSTGRLRTANGSPVTKPVLQQIHLPAGPLPDISLADRIPKPGAIIPPAAELPAQGTADRMAPDISPNRLSMPIEGLDVTRLADTFNDSRDGRKHEALDILAARGTPVHAVAEGNVAKLFTSKQGGLTVYQFDDSGAWCYYYAHLDHYARGIGEGILLRKGDVLGYVGSTGNASPKAPHLHFAVFRLGPDKKWWQGQAIDPLPLLK